MPMQISLMEVFSIIEIVKRKNVVIIGWCTSGSNSPAERCAAVFSWWPATHGPKENPDKRECHAAGGQIHGRHGQLWEQCYNEKL